MVGNEVCEVQGWYGPFTLTEHVLQKIWLRQQFETRDLLTASGKTLEVIDPGKWNLLGGPDFRAAKLRLNGCELRGDVEVHFNSADWFAHRHEVNKEFNQVILHVLLYPELNGYYEVRTSQGSAPETLVLMPLLERDLESIAMDEALLELERVNELEWVVDFLKLPLAARLQHLSKHARVRWEQKCRFAAKRLTTCDWSEACHQLCLEVLGYSRNRAPMAHLALQYPLVTMGSQTIETLYTSDSVDWKLSGLRPANHPRSRLQQYLQVLEANPDWPEKLRDAVASLPPVAQTVTTGNLRRQSGLAQWCRDLREQLFLNQIGQTRFHTFMVDAVLPMAQEAGILDAEVYWTHWSVGDAPGGLRRFLKMVEATSGAQPASNGLTQGALALFYNGGA